MKWAISWPRGWQGKRCENRGPAPPMGKSSAVKGLARSTVVSPVCRLPARFWKHFPCAQAFTMPLGRAPLESQCSAHGKGRSRARPCGALCQARKQSPCHWGAHGARPAKRLCAQQIAKRLPRHWPARSGLAVRAQCAHHRKANAWQPAWRFPRQAASQWPARPQGNAAFQ